MKRGAPQGYTIVEVMIFLAVTAALFAMVALSFSGRQSRTQFAASARDMESQIQDIMNDIATGYGGAPPNTPECQVDPAVSRVLFVGPAAPQGTNAQCVFAGKVLHLGVDGEPETYRVYSVAGARKYNGTEPSDILQSRLAIIPGADQVLRLPPGLEFHSNTANYPSSTLRASSILLLSSAKPRTSEDVSGLLTRVAPIGNATTQSEAQVKDAVNTLSTIPVTTPPTTRENYLVALTILMNPANGFTLCYNSLISDQHVLITVQGKSLSVDSVIRDGDCP